MQAGTVKMELLRCIVCPKQPSFSDVSHLLTHVSSKGHLAHLHKLQVRSHQEVEAGYRLGSYNQWYQQHGVADLLSERMQQKEAKQASKRIGNQRRVAAVKHEIQTNLDPKILSYKASVPVRDVAFRQHPSQLTLRNRRRIMQEEMNNPDFIAVLPFECAGPQLSDSMAINELDMHQPLTPDSGTHLVQSTPHAYYDLPSCSFNDAEVSYLHVPEHTKLKGTIWPGMTMFDAATLEMQKKRNQRKDGSILKHMKANSTMIKPMETTYSPGGTMKRRRHMDDLDNDIDLLEGETPMKKQPLRGQRKARMKGSVNTSNRNLRKSDIIHKSLGNGSISTSPSEKSNFPLSASQHVHHAVCLHGKSDTSKTPVNSLSCNEKRENLFDVYNDDSFRVVRDAVPEDVSSPFLDGIHRFAASGESNMSFVSDHWLQSETVFNQAYDPFKDYRTMRTTTSRRPCERSGKENQNPLSWKQEDLGEPVVNPFQAIDGRFDDFAGDLGSLSAVYAYTKNPLVDDLVFQGQNSTAARGMR